jgi:hypothetical protein
MFLALRSSLAIGRLMPAEDPALMGMAFRHRFAPWFPSLEPVVRSGIRSVG